MAIKRLQRHRIWKVSQGSSFTSRGEITEWSLTSIFRIFMEVLQEKRDVPVWGMGEHGKVTGKTRKTEGYRLSQARLGFLPSWEAERQNTLKEYNLALGICISKELSFDHCPCAGKQEVGEHPLQLSSAGTSVAAGSGPSYSFLGISPTASPCKSQGHPRVSAETEALPWCRNRCGPPPWQLNCSSSSREMQLLAKVMRWHQEHYVNTVWATFITPLHELPFHEGGSLVPLDNLNSFWHEGFYYFMTYFPSII